MSPCSLRDCVNDAPSVLVSSLGSSLVFAACLVFASSITSSTFVFVSVIAASISGFAFSIACAIFSVWMSPCSLRDCVNDAPLVLVSSLGSSLVFAACLVFASSITSSTFVFVSVIAASISGFAFSIACAIFSVWMSPCSLKNCVNDTPEVDVSSADSSLVSVSASTFSSTGSCTVSSAGSSTTSSELSSTFPFL